MATGIFEGLSEGNFIILNVIIENQLEKIRQYNTDEDQATDSSR